MYAIVKCAPIFRNAGNGEVFSVDSEHYIKALEEGKKLVIEQSFTPKLYAILQKCRDVELTEILKGDKKDYKVIKASTAGSDKLPEPPEIDPVKMAVIRADAAKKRADAVAARNVKKEDGSKAGTDAQ